MSSNTIVFPNYEVLGNNTVLSMPSFCCFGIWPPDLGNPEICHHQHLGPLQRISYMLTGCWVCRLKKNKTQNPRKPQRQRLCSNLQCKVVQKASHSTTICSTASQTFLPHSTTEAATKPKTNSQTCSSDVSWRSSSFLNSFFNAFSSKEKQDILLSLHIFKNCQDINIQFGSQHLNCPSCTLHSDPPLILLDIISHFFQGI